MASGTYNPISEPFDSQPTLRPGTRLVSYLNGEVREQAPDGVSFVTQMLEMMTKKTLAVAVGLLVLMVLLFGIGGMLIALVVTMALPVYLATNRQSTLAMKMVGPSPTFYLVDISPHIIRDSRPVQLKDTGIYCTVYTEYQAAVKDPRLIVLNGIQDVREYFSLRLGKEIVRIAGEGELDDKLIGLRGLLNELAERPIDDDAITISQMTVEVKVDGEEAEELRRLSGASLQKQGLRVQHELDGIQRDHYQKLISEDNALLAEMMRPGSDKASLQSALKLRMDAADARFNQNIAILKTAMENGIIEPHQLKRDYPQFMTSLSAALGTLSGNNLTIGNQVQSIEKLAAPDESKGNDKKPQD